jgi:hypothetical protein
MIIGAPRLGLGKFVFSDAKRLFVTLIGLDGFTQSGCAGTIFDHVENHFPDPVIPADRRVLRIAGGTPEDRPSADCRC